MAIRLRKLQGEWIALCAYETNEKENDIYIDDAQHYALSCKDRKDKTGHAGDRIKNYLMDSQIMRDASDRTDL